MIDTLKETSIIFNQGKQVSAIGFIESIKCSNHGDKQYFHNHNLFYNVFF